MNVAVVFNEDFSGVFKLRSVPTKERYTRKVVEEIAEALRFNGHKVEVFDANLSLFENLLSFVKEHGSDSTAVFNLAYGIQGECRYSHIPGVLELLGIMYTGSGPLGHSLALDKVATKLIFQTWGIPTPEFWVVSKIEDLPSELYFPLIVKPRMEASSFGIHLVWNRAELEEAVYNVIENFHQDALIERFIEGREFNIGLIGNGEELKELPITEIDFGDTAFGIYTHEAKLKTSYRRLCPAPLEEETIDEIARLSKKAFRALKLRDYARFDIRMDKDGELYFLEVNSMAHLSRNASFFLAAQTTGYTYEEFINEILKVALRRYGVDA
ncbi:D-alanine--D-alanine ligase [Hydrogenivirga caldilitoris]|uniref:D-alanine--D-alanine ligase n=1 Tax=Hydrogenivirga caldilitoris TaxID=246264 RepID=A0A497XQI6_9AQUI|nr:ATP-grasp domain-containing protein [Hydrogenivirga caldilitoris]RLJ71256.1 D-alanine--D-alanine ligase [Hydrogenivirga caldilitoris]